VSRREDPVQSKILLRGAGVVEDGERFSRQKGVIKYDHSSSLNAILRDWPRWKTRVTHRAPALSTIVARSLSPTHRPLNHRSLAVIRTCTTLVYQLFQSLYGCLLCYALIKRYPKEMTIAYCIQ
jgi:hypothetical protein